MTDVSVSLRRQVTQILRDKRPAQDDRRKLGEQVSEFFFFRLEIFFGVRAGSNFAGDALDDLDSGAFEGFDFFGIVREQAHAGCAQLF